MTLLPAPVVAMVVAMMVAMMSTTSFTRWNFVAGHSPVHLIKSLEI